MTKATVEFAGGPCDGRVQEVPRGLGGDLPAELTFRDLAPPGGTDLGDNAMQVVELVYRLRADAGAAVYDFEAYR
jgi:hypothetical protein